jgi:hypothetical protein
VIAQLHAIALETQVTPRFIMPPNAMNANEWGAAKELLSDFRGMRRA